MKSFGKVKLILKIGVWKKWVIILVFLEIKIVLNYIDNFYCILCFNVVIFIGGYELGLCEM